MRRIRIDIETRKVLVVRRRGAPAEASCVTCGAPMLTPVEAGRLCGADVRDIYRRIEAGGLHILEIEGGEPLVCSRSVAGASVS